MKRTANLARSLAEDVADDFTVMDTILVGLRERVQRDGTDPAALDRLRALIKVRLAALPMVHSLLLLDADGRLLVSGDGVLPRGMNMAASPVFLHHRNSTSPDLFVGPPVRNILDGRWVIKVSRRVNNADGSFAGIVVACMTTDFLQQRFATFDIGPHGQIWMLSRDGLGVAFSPPAPGFTGRDLSHGPLYASVLKDGNQGAFEADSPIDGIRRLSGFHRVPGTPLTVAVGRSKADVLLGWWESAVSHALGLLIVLALIYDLGWRLASRMAEAEDARALLEQTVGQLSESERRLIIANQRLEMAEQIAHVGHWQIDLLNGDAITWSDEVHRIHGHDPASFRPDMKSGIEAFHPDDRPAVRAAIKHTLVTGEPFVFDLRLVRQDGDIRIVRSRGIRQDDASGRPCKMFGVFMDVTDQKEAEQCLLQARKDAEAANRALATANDALETMAMQDALTGLANRRHFNAALDAEYANAAAAAGPLSLILVDIDRFKAYNDLYGHLAGDACLRAVAQAIAGVAATQPGAVACRYGGEEIALLLPHYHEACAMIVAKQIAKAVRHLGICHAGSERGLVTISAGVAALGPGQPVALAAELVEHADQALYAAKASGRDCVLSASAFARAPIERARKDRRVSAPILRLVESSPSPAHCVA